MKQISLIDLQRLIKKGIEEQHELAYWVTAEINELKVNSAGHCYLELVQKNEKNDHLEARVTAVIWANMFRLLKSFFETSTNKTLDSGIKVLVKAYVQYHELYGLSLNIIDIDPSYTIGSIELQRQNTIAQLQEEGVFTMNQELDLSILPQRIAIISSKQAAGYQDFINHLEGNEYGFVFFTRLFNASLQGKDAENSIVEALDAIHNTIDDFDVVVIIRGGGSQADLVCFDSYRLAYHVTQFPLPVLTGIGHDKDISIVDMVAYQMLKTPTAVAAFLIEVVLKQYSIIHEFVDRLSNILHATLLNEDAKMKLYVSKLRSIVREYISQEQVKLKTWLPHRIRLSYQHFLKEQDLKLNQLSTKLEMNNPQAILEKGYAIVSHNGCRLNSAKLVNIHDNVEIVLMDGRLSSDVKGIKINEKL